MLTQLLLQTLPHMLLQLIAATGVLTLLLRHSTTLGRARNPAIIGTVMLFTNALLLPVTAYLNRLMIQSAVENGEHGLIGLGMLATSLIHSLLLAIAIILLGVAITRRSAG